MELDPAALDIPSRYKLLIGCILPRPIALVSTCASDGSLNLAPFSFFSGLGSNPMTLLFCPANNADGSEKDTLRNCKPVSEGGTGEFVVNVAPFSIIKQVSAAAEPLPFRQSEFDLTGLTPCPSVAVTPPRVAESPVSFECRTLHVLRTSPGAPSGGNVVIGHVLRVHARDDVLNDRLHASADALDLCGRMGGQTYCTTRERFDLPPGIDSLTRTISPARSTPHPFRLDH